MRSLLVAALVVTTGCAGSAPAPAPAPAKAPPSAASSSATAPAPVPAADVRNVDAAAAAQWLKDHPETVVLDVRTPEEYAEGHLTGATLIDYKADGFQEKLGALDKSKTYLVHCRSGRRSAETRDAMVSLGFQSIVHMDGGIEAWEAAGQPVEK